MPRRVPIALMLVAGSVVLSLAVFEAGIRLAGVDYRVDGNWRYHPLIGWTQRPDSEFRFTVEDRTVTVSFNRRGLRGPAVEGPPPAGVRRIVLLGDSFTAAVQVPWEETFGAVLERRLAAAGGETWQVVNLGVSDFGNLQQLLMLEDYAAPLRPAVVIHQVFPLNDVCNNNPALAGLCRSQNDAYRPYPVVADDGVPRPRPLQPWRKALRDRLASFHLGERLWIRFTRLRPEARNPDYWGERFAAAGFGAVDPLLHAYLPEAAQRPETRPGWPLTEAVIAETVRRVQRSGAAYLGLVIPFHARLGEAWPRLARRLPPGTEADYPERRLGALYDRLGVPAVMARTVFDAEPEAQSYLESDGHLNTRGHEQVARALHQALIAQGLVEH